MILSMTRADTIAFTIRKEHLGCCVKSDVSGARVGAGTQGGLHFDAGRRGSGGDQTGGDQTRGDDGTERRDSPRPQVGT